MLVLDENPQNFFAQIEQAAFATSNIVPELDFLRIKCSRGEPLPTAIPKDTALERTLRSFLSTVLLFLRAMICATAL